MSRRPHSSVIPEAGIQISSIVPAFAGMTQSRTYRRTADHLFWMSRYTERAENTARMLDVNYQTSLLPQSADAAQVGWEGPADHQRAHARVQRQVR